MFTDVDLMRVRAQEGGLLSVSLYSVDTKLKMIINYHLDFLLLELHLQCDNHK